MFTLTYDDAFEIVNSSDFQDLEPTDKKYLAEFLTQFEWKHKEDGAVLGLKFTDKAEAYGVANTDFIQWKDHDPHMQITVSPDSVEAVNYSFYSEPDEYDPSLNDALKLIRAIPAEAFIKVLESKVAEFESNVYGGKTYKNENELKEILKKQEWGVDSDGVISCEVNFSCFNKSLDLRMGFDAFEGGDTEFCFYDKHLSYLNLKYPYVKDIVMEVVRDLEELCSKCDLFEEVNGAKLHEEYSREYELSCGFDRGLLSELNEQGDKLYKNIKADLLKKTGDVIKVDFSCDEFSFEYPVYNCNCYVSRPELVCNLWNTVYEKAESFSRENGFLPELNFNANIIFDEKLIQKSLDLAAVNGKKTKLNIDSDYVYVTALTDRQEKYFMERFPDCPLSQAQNRPIFCIPKAELTDDQQLCRRMCRDVRVFGSVTDLVKGKNLTADEVLALPLKLAQEKSEVQGKALGRGR